MINKAVRHGLLYLALATAVSLQADTIVLGIPAETANCDPFGCPAFFGLGTYQQVYAASSFPGVITIDDIGFYQSQILNNGGVLAGGTYTMSLSYTSASPGALDFSDGPSANIAPGTEAEFFSAALPALTPYLTENILTFSGTPFVYDPADGNLLLTVSVTGGASSPPYLFLDESAPSSVTSSAYFGTVDGANATGLVTGMNYTPLTGSSTPEPGSLLLVLAGIGLIGYQGRRRTS